MTIRGRPRGPHRRKDRRGRNGAFCPKKSRILAGIAAAMLLVQTSTAAASAQEVPMLTDSLANAARTAGILEAEFGSVNNSFNIAFVAGIPLGFLGLFAFQSGALAFSAPLILGVTLPTYKRQFSHPQRTAQFARYGPRYRFAYEDAYRRRLSQRRRTASIAGSYLGAMVGFGGFMWWFFSNYE